MSKTTNPSKLALCIMIADNDHRDGVLLERIIWWWKYAYLPIPKKAGKWIANKHEFWRKEACLSPDQLTRTLRRLESKGLIERAQYWFEGRNIMWLRPTAKTVEFLQAAKTWSAANELIADVENHATEIGKCAKPSLAQSPNSNGLSKIAEPSSANLPNSNYIKTKHIIQHKIVTSGSSAVPTYPAKKNCSHAESGSEEVGTAEISQIAVDYAPDTPMALGTATKTWIKSVKNHCPGQQDLTMSANQKGFLALIAQDLGQCSKGNAKSVSFQAQTDGVIGRPSLWIAEDFGCCASG